MASKKDEFLKHLLATFRVEADDHLRIITEGLRQLDVPGAVQPEIIERIFREVHSLKGAARSVNLPAIESICQALESIFAVLKNGQLALNPALLDLMQDSVDELSAHLGMDQGAAAKPTAALLARLGNALHNASARHGSALSMPAEREPHTTASSSSVSEERPASAKRPLPAAGLSETVRVPTAKLGVVMRRAEELLSSKLAAHQRNGDLRELGVVLADRIRQRTAAQPWLRELQKSAAKTNGEHKEIAKLFDYIEAETLFLQSLEKRIGTIAKSTERDDRTLTRMVDGQLHEVRNLLMLPFAPLLEIYPRLMRDLARDQGKEVELIIHGAEIEVDRRILEEIKDPLLHLLRNCIDHGIETPAQRLEKQKAASGTITVSVVQRDSQVEIVVADDGRGVDAEQVQAAARKQGVTTGEKFSADEALTLIFQSGVSTSSIITDISGRGLGLAIVREKVERLGGTVVLETKPGAGTAFRMMVPLTLTTIRGVLVRVDEQLYILPLHNVECVSRIAATEIRTVEHRETIFHKNKVVALAWLGDVLELPRHTEHEAAGTVHVAVLCIDATRIAFRVDEILGEQEVLVKMLGWQLSRVRNVAGACVLGTGRVVPVLNPADLLKSAVMHAASEYFSAPAEPSVRTQQQSILVAEDSITSRALLKYILEAAGYCVAVAVDGLDAWRMLEAGRFDLVVSDVEMPRMNGFELTQKIRSSPRLVRLPVVLVTALDTREDREHGIEVGANAYFVKGSFEHGNLLQLIGQLI
ncbi:MAG: response regulator [Pseudomonadota bacterium]